MARYKAKNIERLDAWRYDGTPENQRYLINMALGYVTYGPNGALYVTDRDGNKLLVMAGDYVTRHEPDEWGVKTQTEIAGSYELD